MMDDEDANEQGEIWLSNRSSDVDDDHDGHEEVELDVENDDDEEEGDGCFFADVMIEDAHHLVESPAQARPIQSSPGKVGTMTMEMISSPLPPFMDRHVGGGNGHTSTGRTAASTSDGSNTSNGGVEKEGIKQNGPTNGHDHVDVNAEDDASSFDEREMNRLSYMEIALRPQESSDSATHDHILRQSPMGVDNFDSAAEGSSHHLRRRRPALPRDIGWAAFATIFCPLSLMLPWYITRSSHHSHDNEGNNDKTSSIINHHLDGGGWQQVSLSRRAHVATFVSGLAAFALSNFLSTLMYRNPSSGDDGEEERHLASGRITLIGHYVALLMYPTLIAMIWTEFPEADNVGFYTIVLLILGIRDFWVLRKSFKIMSLVLDGAGRGDAGRGRRMFFQTLVCASLDVISRSSLRRLVFYRIVSGAIVIQFCLVLWWRSALFKILGVRAEEGHNLSHLMFIAVVLIGGKWMTAIIARILGFVASGGIIVWFEQQQYHLERTMSIQEESNHSGVAADDTTTTSVEGDDHEERNDEQHEDIEGGGEDTQSSELRTEEDESDEIGSSLSGGATSNAGGISDENGVPDKSSRTTKDAVQKEVQRPKQQFPRRSRRNLYSNPSSRRAASTSSSANHIPMPSLDLWQEDHDYMADAYTSVNRNEYRSVNDFEDPRMHLDDNEDWDDERLTDTVGPSLSSSPSTNTNNNGIGSSLRSWIERLCAFRRAALQSNYIEGTTAKHFLLQATTLSFGSIAQCALLGGVAQFLWSCTRNVKFARLAAAQRRLQRRTTSRRQPFHTTGGGGASGFGFQSMEIGDSDGFSRHGRNGSSMPEHLIPYIYDKASLWSTTFVRSHTDYGMAFVAAYFKSYQRASKHAFRLIDASGLAAIVHDDISTSICSSVCFALSGIIVVIVGVTLSHHRGLYLNDTVLCDAMVISFLMCYVILFTTMEPLRASIKALYVCYAQYPTSLSQAFPLVYHRLDRISMESFNQ